MQSTLRHAQQQARRAPAASLAGVLSRSTGCCVRSAAGRRLQAPRVTAQDAERNATTGSSTSTGAAQPSSVLDPAFAQELLGELQDQSKLGQRGEGWTIAQFVAIALVLLPPFHATELTTAVGVLLLLGGLGAIGLALSDLGTALTPLPAPRNSSQLVTTGIYAYVRHPMYGGLLMASLGLAAVTHDEARLLAAAALWLVLEHKVNFEERLLTERYGPAYASYQARVKKLVPWLY